MTLVIRDDVQVSFSAQCTGFQDETPHGCSGDFAGTGASKPGGIGLNPRKTFTSAGKEQVTAVRHNPGSAFIREIQNRIKVRRPARAENPSHRWQIIAITVHSQTVVHARDGTRGSEVAKRNIDFLFDKVTGRNVDRVIRIAAGGRLTYDGWCGNLEIFAAAFDGFIIEGSLERCVRNRVNGVFTACFSELICDCGCPLIFLIIGVVPVVESRQKIFAVDGAPLTFFFKPSGFSTNIAGNITEILEQLM